MSQLNNKLKLLTSSTFTLQSAQKLGISRGYIRKWLKDETIERVSHGTYRVVTFEEDIYNELAWANSIVGRPSAICLLSALEFYNLTDHITNQIWVMVSNNKKTSHKKIRLYRKQNPLWSIGVIKKEYFSITTIERTLVDCLIMRKKIGSSLAIDAIKLALNTKKTSLSKIIRLAKQMGVFHRIELLIEALV